MPIRRWCAILTMCLLAGCLSRPQVYVLSAGDRCVIADPPYQVIVDCSLNGVGIEYFSANPTNTISFKGGFTEGAFAGHYSVGREYPCDEFGFILLDTNWEYDIVRVGTNNYTLYSIDQDGDGIPDYRHIQDATNLVTFEIHLSTKTNEFR